MHTENKRHTCFRKILKCFIVGTNIPIFILLLSSVLAWYVSPEQTVIFSYIGLAFPIILVVSLIYTLLWLFTKNWKLFSISLATILLSWPTISTYFPVNKIFNDNNIHSLSKQDSIRLMTYNVRAFNWYLTWDGKINPIFNFLKESNTDIICFQEFVASRGKEKSIATPKQIQKMLQHYPYYSVVELPASNDNHIYGLACYSKYPIVHTEKIIFQGNSYNGAAKFRIQVGEYTYTIFNNHLESNKITDADKRLYQEFLEGKNSEVITDVANNIQSRLNAAYRIRARQANMLAEEIKKEQNHSRGVIVCGDFNDTPISYAYHTIKGGMKDAFVMKGMGVGITYNQPYFLFRIDHILYDATFSALQTEIKHISYSDHYPVTTTLLIEQ